MVRSVVSARLASGLLVVVIILVLPDDGLGQMKVAGPFRVLAGHLEDCPVHLRPKKLYSIFRTTHTRDRKRPDILVFSGNLTTFFTLDDEITGLLNIASWSQRGGWLENAHKRAMPKICTWLYTYFRDMWQQTMKSFFNNAHRKCPFLPGFYSVENYTTDFDIKFPPIFFYGKFRGTVQLVRAATKEVVFCLRTYAEVIPKIEGPK